MATQEIVGALQQSQSHLPGPRKEAEKYLKGAGKNPGFASALINVLLTQGIDLAVQQAAAVAFKNHVKYHWVRGQTPTTTTNRQAYFSWPSCMSVQTETLFYSQVSPTLLLSFSPATIG
jgi:exportin-2 (importin alpha re-exporter)